MNRSVTVAGRTYTMFAEGNPGAFTEPYLYSICAELKDLQVNNNKIMRAFSQQGGWEPWAQVECALTLQEMGSQPSVKREQAVYDGSNDLIDLWIEGQNQTKVGIELKCRNVNHGHMDSETGLPAHFLKDAAKIRRTLKQAFATGNRRMFAIGVTGNPLDCVWNTTTATANIASRWHAAHATQVAYVANPNTAINLINPILPINPADLVPNLDTRLKWCQFFGPRTIEQDIQQFFVGNSTWTNLYLIWYEA